MIQMLKLYDGDYIVAISQMFQWTIVDTIEISGKVEHLSREREDTKKIQNC